LDKKGRRGYPRDCARSLLNMPVSRKVPVVDRRVATTGGSYFPYAAGFITRRMGSASIRKIPLVLTKLTI